MMGLSRSTTVNLEQTLQILTVHQETLKHLTSLVTQEEARTFRESKEAWTILEVMCHLKDFEVIFIERVEVMLKKITPTFAAFDQNEAVIAHKYSEQTLSEVVQAFSLYRERTLSLFKNLEPQQWQRMGLHPKRGRTSMTDMPENLIFHDSKHIRQVSRILAAKHQGRS
jgi:DinB superfamily